MSANSIGRENRTTLMMRARLRDCGGDRDAQIQDASSRGLLMSAAQAPSRGEIVEVFVGSTVLVGQVRWNRGNRFGVVLQDRIDVAALQRGGPAVQSRRSSAHSDEAEEGWALSDVLFFAACGLACAVFLLYIARKVF